MVEVHAKFDSVFAKMPIAAPNSLSGYEALEQAFDRRPGMLCIVTIDECVLGSRATYFCSLPAVIDEESPSILRAQMPEDGDWLKLLKQRLAFKDNARKAVTRAKALRRWIDSETICQHIFNAGKHALDLQKQPNRTG